jgi:hypothetical protein
MNDTAAIVSKRTQRPRLPKRSTRIGDVLYASQPPGPYGSSFVRLSSDARSAASTNARSRM